MKEPAGLMNEDKRWNKRERLLNQVLREYLLDWVPEDTVAPNDTSQSSGSDKLAQALDFYLKGNK